MADNKPLTLDNDVYEEMTRAIWSLFYQYGEIIGQEILFEKLSADSGYAFEAAGGAEVITRKQSVTGKITDSCQYPAVFIRRTASTSEKQKLDVQTFLDTLGKWICMEEVEINKKTYRLKEYPKLTRGRTITEIRRYNSSSQEANENGVQDWGLPLYIYYTHEYYKNK